MKILSETSYTKYLIANIYVIIIGIAYGTISVIALGYDTKWTLTFILFLICIPVFLLNREKKKLAIAFLILTLPLSLDIYLIRFDSLPYRVPISGLRITLFDIIFIPLFVFWFFRLIAKSENTNITIPSILFLFIGIFIFFTFSSIISPLPYGIKIAYLWYSLVNILIILFIVSNVHDEKTVKYFVTLFIISGVVQSLLSIFQYMSGSTLGLDIIGESEKGYWSMKAGSGYINRVSGTLGHPNRLSSFLTGLFPLNLALIFIPVKKHKTLIFLLYASSILIIVVANILTYSRGGLISLAVSGGLCSYWLLTKRFKIKILSALFVISAISITIIGTMTFVDPVRQRFIETDYGSLATRVPLSKVAFNMIRENPLLGVGPGSFNAESNKYDRTNQNISYSFPAPVHNEFLLIASEIGLPALFLFLSVLIITFKRLYKITKSNSNPILTYLAIGFFCSWVGWCLHRMIAYDYILLHSGPFMTLGIIYAMDNISCSNK